MTPSEPSIDLLSVNTLRTLAIDAVQKANSGHPGLPLGAAPMAYVLWQRYLKHDPRDPRWPDRDRFVLSAGHGSTLLYSLLHLTGYDLSLADLQAFRQLGSRTPGHPEAHVTPGVEATTGPLGQGGANAVGMAICERALAHLFNRPGYALVDHWTYALVSDGDLMEGVNAEAASLAGHLRLGKLVYLYDANGVSLDGPTSLTFTEDVKARYAAYGWHVQEVARGDTDLDAIDRALGTAKSDTSRPHLVVVRTTIGFGSPAKAGTAHAHGSPLGPEEVKRTKEALGWDPDAQFFVPDRALRHLRAAVERGGRSHAAWRETLAAYEKAHPELAALWRGAQEGEMPVGFDAELPRFAAGDQVSTRKAAGAALNAIARRVPYIIGGDADLGTSTLTVIKDGGDFQGQSGAGRNLHFGVREHAMGAIVNGIAYHRGLRPYAATFFTFSDYMRPAVRLAAIERLPVVFVYTHDSVWLGEDGPTHQPIEHLMALRTVPGLVLLRPADAAEAAEAWRFAAQRTAGPVAIVLTRQDLPVLDRSRLGGAAGVARGAYVLAEAKGGAPEVILIATGSEVWLAAGARDLLAEDGVRARVVSMPSWELFAAQDEAYRESVLPRRVTARVSVEAGVTLGWERWLGAGGVAVGLDRYGASAPADVLMRHLGFTADRVAEAARRALARS